MSLIGIPISPDECIGDSLTTINNAFIELDTRTLNITGGTANFNPTKVAFNGNGTTTSFSLAGIGTLSDNEANYRVTLNGVVQEPDVDYYISGTNIIFTTAPASTDRIVVVTQEIITNIAAGFAGTTTATTLTADNLFLRVGVGSYYKYIQLYDINGVYNEPITPGATPTPTPTITPTPNGATPTPTPTVTPTRTPTPTSVTSYLFALGPGTFDGSNYFSENGSQQINMTSSTQAYRSYFYDNYDGSTLSYTNTVVIVDGTPVASISHTTDRIGDQFGFSVSGLNPVLFGILTGGNVYLTTGGATPTPTPTPTLTPVAVTPTPNGTTFTLGPGTFDGTNYFTENGSQQINMTSSGANDRLYLYNNYDGSTLSYTSTVIIVNGTPRASISHTTDRIGDQFGYSTSGSSPQAFGTLTGGNVYLTI